MQEKLEENILIQVQRPVLVFQRYSKLLPLVSNMLMLILCKEITEAKKNKKDTAPVRKVNTRGVLKIDGYSDFNPDLNL
jgi:hypothetical protein